MVKTSVVFKCSAICARTEGIASLLLVAVFSGCSYSQDDTELLQGSWSPRIIVSSQSPDSSGVGSENESYGLTRDDFQRLSETIPTIQRIVPWRRLETKIESSRNQDLPPIEIIGSVAEFGDIIDLEVESGRFITARDTLESNAVIILDRSLSKKLFPLEDPIGQTIRVGEKPFRIVGIYKDTKEHRDLGRRPRALIPYSTMRQRFGDQAFSRADGKITSETYELSGAIIEIDDIADLENTLDIVKKMLNQQHDDDDIVVRDNRIRRK